METAVNMPDQEQKCICLFCHTGFKLQNSSMRVGAYFLCSECAALAEDNIPVICVQDSPVFEKQQPIVRVLNENNDNNGSGAVMTSIYPTGEYAMFSHEAVNRLFGPERLEAAKAYGCLYVRPDVMAGVKDIYKKTMTPAPLKAQNPEDAADTQEAAKNPTEERSDQP